MEKPKFLIHITGEDPEGSIEIRGKVDYRIALECLIKVMSSKNFKPLKIRDRKETGSDDNSSQAIQQIAGEGGGV